MSGIKVTSPDKIHSFNCDFCENPDTIAVLDKGEQEIEICRACAMELVHGLKTKITNDLLGISEEEN